MDRLYVCTVCMMEVCYTQPTLNGGRAKCPHCGSDLFDLG